MREICKLMSLLLRDAFNSEVSGITIVYLSLQVKVFDLYCPYPQLWYKVMRA